MTKGLVYLATPYSDPDPAIREKRFQIVNKVAAKLMREGMFIFSPISHTHPIALAGELPTGFEYWEEYDICILSACKALYVLRQPGWEYSRGVHAEVCFAIANKIPVTYINV